MSFFDRGHTGKKDNRLEEERIVSFYRGIMVYGAVLGGIGVLTGGLLVPVVGVIVASFAGSEVQRYGGKLFDERKKIKGLPFLLGTVVGNVAASGLLSVLAMMSGGAGTSNVPDGAGAPVSDVPSVVMAPANPVVSPAAAFDEALAVEPSGEATPAYVGRDRPDRSRAGRRRGQWSGELTDSAGFDGFVSAGFARQSRLPVANTAERASADYRDCVRTERVFDGRVVRRSQVYCDYSAQ